MPSLNASSVPAPSVAPSGIHEREVTDDSIRKASSFWCPAAFSLARSDDARGFQVRGAVMVALGGRGSTVGLDLATSWLGWERGRGGCGSGPRWGGRTARRRGRGRRGGGGGGEEREAAGQLAVGRGVGEVPGLGGGHAAVDGAADGVDGGEGAAELGAVDGRADLGEGGGGLAPFGGGGGKGGRVGVAAEAAPQEGGHPVGWAGDGPEQAAGGQLVDLVPGQL